MASKLAGYGAIAGLFPGTAQQQEYTEELREMLAEFVQTSGLFEDADQSLLEEAAAYLFHELSTGGKTFVVSQAAVDLYDGFHEHLKKLGANDRFAGSLKSVQKSRSAAFELARDWVVAYVGTASGGRQSPDASGQESSGRGRFDGSGD